MELTARGIAARIIQQPTREARASMLMQAPGHLQPIIRTLVKIHFERRRYDTGKRIQRIRQDRHDMG